MGTPNNPTSDRWAGTSRYTIPLAFAPCDAPNVERVVQVTQRGGARIYFDPSRNTLYAMRDGRWFKLETD